MRDLGDPQPHRRQPPPHERHARAAADHPRAAVVHRDRRDRQPLGRRPQDHAATTRRTRCGRSATCSSSRASTASGSRGSTCTAGSRRRSAARGGTRPWSGLRARRGRRCGRSRRSCAGFDDPQRHGQQRGRGAVAGLDGQHLVVERRHAAARSGTAPPRPATPRPPAAPRRRASAAWLSVPAVRWKPMPRPTSTSPPRA